MTIIICASFSPTVLNTIVANTWVQPRDDAQEHVDISTCGCGWLYSGVDMAVAYIKKTSHACQDSRTHPLTFAWSRIGTEDRWCRYWVHKMIYIFDLYMTINLTITIRKILYPPPGPPYPCNKTPYKLTNPIIVNNTRLCNGPNGSFTCNL